MKKFIPIILFLIPVLLSGCTDRLTFDPPHFVCFMPEESSSTIVNAQGSFEGSYKVHLSTVKPDDTIIVKWSIIPGSGMQEGVDFIYEGKDKNLMFYSGVYDRDIKIKWLKHDIDPNKDNTVTLRLESCNDPSILIGMPGPSQKNRQIVINKYSD